MDLALPHFALHLLAVDGAPFCYGLFELDLVGCRFRLAHALVDIDFPETQLQFAALLIIGFKPCFILTPLSFFFFHRLLLIGLQLLKFPHRAFHHAESEVRFKRRNIDEARQGTRMPAIGHAEPGLLVERLELDLHRCVEPAIGEVDLRREAHIRRLRALREVGHGHRAILDLEDPGGRSEIEDAITAQRREGALELVAGIRRLDQVGKALRIEIGDLEAGNIIAART